MSSPIPLWPPGPTYGTVRALLVTATALLLMSGVCAVMSAFGVMVGAASVADFRAHHSFLLSGTASIAVSALFVHWSAEALHESVSAVRLALRIRREQMVREVMES